MKVLHTTVLARAPMVSTVNKDGRFVSTLIVLVEINSIDSVLRTVKLRFIDRMAEIISEFLGPDDVITINNLKIPLGYKFEDDNEIQLGQVLLDDIEIKDKNQFDALNPLDDLVTLTITRLRCYSIFPDSYYVKYSHHDTKLWYYCPPTWLKEHPPSRPSLTTLSFDFHYFFSNHFLCSENVTDSLYPYSDLIFLQPNTISYYFACVIDVSRSVKLSTIPLVGSAYVMNVSLCDPSICATYRAALLPSNTIRISLLIIAPEISSLPSITCGDIIRVQGSQLSVNQKSNKIFFNSSMNPIETSLSMWSIEQLTRVNIQATSIDHYLPHWSSVSYSAMSREWIRDTKKPMVTKTDWHHIQRLAQWVVESLKFYSCFTNDFLISLDRIWQSLWNPCDLLFRVNNIHLNTAKKTHHPIQQSNTYITSRYPVAQSNFQPRHFFSSPSTLHNLSTVSIQFQVTDGSPILCYDSSGKTIINETNRILNLDKMSNAMAEWISLHIHSGDWILIKNIIHMQIDDTRDIQTVLQNQYCTESYTIDISRSRIVKIPFCSQEVQLRLPQIQANIK